MGIFLTLYKMENMVRELAILKMSNSARMLQFFLLFCAASFSRAAYWASGSGGCNCMQVKSKSIEFYVHDQFTGPNRSVLQVAGPGTTTNVQFGLLGVVDDLITEGQSVDSKALGRMRGTYTVASLDGLTFYVSFSAVFESKKYNGTLNISGASRILDSQRTLPVVGVTGDFEHASGFAHATSVSFDSNTSVTFYNIQLTQP